MLKTTIKHELICLNVTVGDDEKKNREEFTDLHGILSVSLWISVSLWVCISPLEVLIRSLAQ